MGRGSRGERGRINPQAETCAHCGQQKPITLVLRAEEGDKLLCRDCANEWLESDQEWPENAQKETKCPS